MIHRILNLGMMAHVDAGKTSVTEGLLYHCGVLSSMGRVDKGTTVTDSMELEQQRGLTIRASTVSFTVGDTKINLIDTPGHMDFIGEVERSLAVLDGVVLIVSAKEGVQPQTRVIFRKLRQMKVPTLFFVNKIDRAGVDLDELLRQIRTLLTPKILTMQTVELAPGGTPVVRPLTWDSEALTEELLLQSESLFTRYLRGEALTGEDYCSYTHFRVRKARLYPVYFGSALEDIGIRALLDAVAQWLSLEQPSPAPEEPLSAFVYKVQWEGNKKLAFVRLFSGQLQLRGKVVLEHTGEEIQIKNLICLQNGRQVPAPIAQKGDIAILSDCPQVRCGDTLGIKTKRKGKGSMAKPLLTVGVSESTGRRRELLDALARLNAEDPLLELRIQEETGEITLSLFGKLQQEILETTLRQRFGLDAAFQGMRTVCREQPKGTIRTGMRIWTAGNPHEAGIELDVSPLPTGSGIVYETQVSFGFIQRPFQAAVRDGVLTGLSQGIETSVTDVKVIFTDADFSSVTSTPADFRRLAPMVVRKALELIGVHRLQPVMRYTLFAPAGSEKHVLRGLTDTRAIMESLEYQGEELSIRGLVPFDTAKDFAAVLQSITGGKGLFEMELVHYRDLERDSLQ